MPWRGPEESPRVPPGTAPTAPFDPGGSIGRAGARRWSHSARRTSCPPAVVAGGPGLASVFEDRKSYSGFKARCEEAWRGELSVDRLVSAYEQAMGPKAKNRGAVFIYAMNREQE